MPVQFHTYTVDDLRARFRYLMDMANRSKMDRDEALDLLAIAAEFGSRGYVLNADGSDWQPARAPVCAGGTRATRRTGERSRVEGELISALTLAKSQ